MSRKKKSEEEPEDKGKNKSSKDEDLFIDEEKEREFIEALMSRPYLELDNEFLIRKDFLVGMLKSNNFTEDKYSIVIFHESLDDSIGTIWQKECFVSASPKQRDEHFTRIKIELNGF
jgi:hypothetical protein